MKTRTRQLLLSSCVLVSIALPSTAAVANPSARQPFSPTASAPRVHGGAPTASDPVVLSGSIKKVPAPKKGTVTPLNTAVGDCPNKVPGASCTVDYTVSEGPFSTQFTYVQDGVPQSLPAGYYYCTTPTCSLYQTGAGPTAIPDAWFVDGNNAFINSMS